MILNERGDVIRSHLDEAAATAEYERLNGMVARRTLAHVQPRSGWLDGFRAGYLKALHGNGDHWLEQRIERYAAAQSDPQRYDFLPLDPYHFQYWALGLLNGRPTREQQDDANGIDGRLYFHDEGRGCTAKQVVVRAKSGHAEIADIKLLRDALEREQAEMAVLLTDHIPAKQAFAEAAKAGFYVSPLTGERYPRVQILTVSELGQGKGIEYPGVRGNMTGSSVTSAEAAKPASSLPNTRAKR